MTTLPSPLVGPVGSVSGRGTLIRVEDNAGPFLEALARNFPSEFVRALRSTGYWLRGEIVREVRSKGGARRGWENRSLISQYRPFDRLKRGRVKKRWTAKAQRQFRAGRSLHTALGSYGPLLKMGHGKSSRVGSPDSFGSGKMAGRGGVTYKLDAARQSLQVGFLGSTSAFAKMLQGGRLGAKRRWNFRGRQAVTPAMRRMFWAAGVPIASSTKFIEAEPRELVKPLFDEKRGEIVKRMELRVKAYVEGLSSRAASQFVHRNM